MIASGTSKSEMITSGTFGGRGIYDLCHDMERLRGRVGKWGILMILWHFRLCDLWVDEKQCPSQHTTQLLLFVLLSFPRDRLLCLSKHVGARVHHVRTPAFVVRINTYSGVETCCSSTAIISCGKQAIIILTAETTCLVQEIMILTVETTCLVQMSLTLVITWVSAGRICALSQTWPYLC